MSTLYPPPRIKYAAVETYQHATVGFGILKIQAVLMKVNLE